MKYELPTRPRRRYYAQIADRVGPSQCRQPATLRSKKQGERVQVKRVATAVSTIVLGLALSIPGVAAASSFPTPPDNPTSNIPSSVSGEMSCGASTDAQTLNGVCNNPCITMSGTTIVPISTSDQCIETALQAINNAHISEGIAPVTLPSNWFALTSPEHLFVIADLERISMGEIPFIGLNPTLDATAQTGADNNSDPSMPSINGILWMGGDWAGAFPGTLAVDYSWMYYDGYGGNNLDCTSPTSSGCWGHRDNILAQPQCNSCYMGAGVVPGTSYADLFVETQTPLPCSFSWENNVVPYLANGISSPPGPMPQSFSFATNTFPITSPVVGIASTPIGNGYWIVDAKGYVSALGDAINYGGMGGSPLNSPISHIVSTIDGEGYWLVATDGGVFSFGNAQFYGSMGGKPLNAPVMDIVPTANGEGYWLVATDGGVFSFGNAQFYGSMGGTRLNAPVNGGSFAQGGYRMVANDGGIFDFGGAQFYGSMGGHPLNAPIVGMANTLNGEGYWLVASDGGIFSFGNAQFYGSLGATSTSTSVVGMAVDAATGGYWIVDQGGQVFGYNASTLSPSV